MPPDERSAATALVRKPSLSFVRTCAPASGAAEGLVGPEHIGGWFGVALVVRPRYERVRDDVQEVAEGNEIAAAGGGECLLDEVVARSSTT